MATLEHISRQIRQAGLAAEQKEGGPAAGVQVLPGGRADQYSEKDFDPAALEKGIAHEMEHTKDRQTAAEIAMDHLAEDPQYYDKLEDAGLRGVDTKMFCRFAARSKVCALSINPKEKEMIRKGLEKYKYAVYVQGKGTDYFNSQAEAETAIQKEKQWGNLPLVITKENIDKLAAKPTFSKPTYKIEIIDKSSGRSENIGITEHVKDYLPPNVKPQDLPSLNQKKVFSQNFDDGGVLDYVVTRVS